MYDTRKSRKKLAATLSQILDFEWQDVTCSLAVLNCKHCPPYTVVTFRNTVRKSELNKGCILSTKYVCIQKGVCLKYKLHHDGNLSVAAQIPPPVLSPSNILPPPAPHCALTPARKNTVHVSKMIFHFLTPKKFRKSGSWDYCQFPSHSQSFPRHSQLMYQMAAVRTPFPYSIMKIVTHLKIEYKNRIGGSVSQPTTSFY
jgi:hypothetical protein